MANSELTEFEKQLAIARHNGDQERCLGMLRLTEFAIPISEAAFRGTEPPAWASYTDSAGQSYVLAYTSVPLMTEATGGHAKYARRMTLAGMASAWPDNRWHLAINPATPLEFRLESGTIARLAGVPMELQKHATPEMPVPPVQKVLTLDDVYPVLSDQQHRVSGYVHKLADVAHLTDPLELLRALGVPSSTPYLSDDGSIFLLRWYAVGPALYPSPIGGRDAEQSQAAAGWVIEEEPFVGLGLVANPDVVIQEYKINAVVLPQGATLTELMPDGTEVRRAMFDADRDRWMLVRKRADFPAAEPPPGDPMALFTERYGDDDG